MKGIPRVYKYLIQEESSVLRDADDEFNEIVSRQEDFLLTLLAGLPPALGINAKSRRRLALTYLQVESVEDPLCSFRGERILVDDPESALREILTRSKVDATEIEQWVRDATASLTVPPGKTSRWVNRRVMFLRDLSHDVEQEKVWDLVDKVHPFFLAGKTAELGEAEPEPEPDYSKSGRSLISSIFGPGEKKDRATESRIAAAALAYLEDLEEDATPTSAVALPVILRKAGIDGEDFPPDTLTGRRPSMTNMLRHHKLGLKEQEKAPKWGNPWDFEIRKRLLKACLAQLKGNAKSQREDLSWMQRFGADLFPNMPYSTDGWSRPLVDALMSVFSHHTMVSNQELARAKLLEKARTVADVLQEHPRAVACLDAYVARRREEVQARSPDEDVQYRLRSRATTGWKQLRGEYEQTPSEGERLEIAKTLPHRLGRVKAGDHRLFSFLATEEAKEAGCWEVVALYVEWLDTSARAAHTLVPRFQHKTATRARASMTWGDNAWSIKIDEEEKGHHAATLRLFNDPEREITISIRNARADRELLIGSKVKPTAHGRHGSLGGPAPEERPITGVGTKGPKDISRQNWALRYENGRPYLCHVAKIMPLKSYVKEEDYEVVVGVDQGLRNCMAYAVARYVPDAESIIERNLDTLTPCTSLVEDEEHIIAYDGTADGHPLCLRRVGRDPYRWIEFVKFGTVHAQGRHNRKASREEHAFSVSLRKRSGSRQPVKKHLKATQRATVDSLRRLVNALGHVVRAIVAMRGDNVGNAVELWRSVALRGNDYKTRHAARRAWVRVFGDLPGEELSSLVPSKGRLMESADILERAWSDSEEEIDALVSKVEHWIAPQQAGPEARMAGGLHEDRLETLRKLLSLLRAWEGRPTLANPKKRWFRGEYPPRLQRVDALLQRKKVEQQRQAVAEFFARIREFKTNAVVLEKLSMAGDQTQSRRRNRQGARLAPARRRTLHQERAQLEGIVVREANAAYTSQVDYHTGRPGLRVRMVSVEEFAHGIKHFRKSCGFHRDRDVRQASLELVETLYEKWDPDQKTWIDERGTWRLDSQVPAVRWAGLGEHPRHVLVPDAHGSIFLSVRDGTLRQMDADMNAAANIILSALTWPWQQRFPAGTWGQKTKETYLEILGLLRARELHAAPRVADHGPRVQSCSDGHADPRTSRNFADPRDMSALLATS